MRLSLNGSLRISFVIGVILFAPFFCILVVLGVNGSFAHVDFAAVMRDIPAFESINIGVFISTLVWALGGFDSVGAVRDKGRNDFSEICLFFLSSLQEKCGPGCFSRDCV